LACPFYCATCTSGTVCTTLASQYSMGYVLVTANSMTNLAVCDPGCVTCSTNNPSFCLVCMNGFYMAPNANASSTISTGICSPCTPSSNCMQCSSSNPATCLSCYPGSTLVSSTSACQLCSSSCATCSPGTPASCTLAL
jgi:hypothetical protein